MACVRDIRNDRPRLRFVLHCELSRHPLERDVILMVLRTEVVASFSVKERMPFADKRHTGLPFFRNPAHHRPQPFHRTAFTDYGLINGF